MNQHDDLFDLVDACDLRVPDKRTITERPDLLELYTRRSVKIKPVKWTDKSFATVYLLACGLLIYMTLVMCL